MVTKVKSGVIGDNSVGIDQLNVSDGSNGQALTTNGSGTLSFSTISSGLATSGGTLTGNLTMGGMILKPNADGGSIGLNRNPDNGNHVGDSTLRRFQINGPDSTGGDFIQIQSYNSSGTHQGNVNIQDGLVGIGVTPTHHLHVNAGTTNVVAVFESSDTEATIRIKDNTGTAAVKCRNDFRFNTSESTELMRLNSSGQLGIGETSPDQLLHIKSTGDAAIKIEADSDNANEDDNAYIEFSQDGGLVTGYVGYDTNTNEMTVINKHSGSALTLKTADTTRMVINGNGRIGIGTDGGNAGLHVANGDIRCTAAAVANDANSISMSQESNNNSYIVSRGNSTSERGNIHLTVSRSNGGGGINGLIVASDGSVSKNSGSFKIDHPLDSKKDTHHLVHSFVEGPQADNMYRGVVALENGTATINLDTVSGMTEGTFVALNTDIQCFTSNETDWDSVKGSISGNILSISCQNTSSTATVSWLVIGERQDQHMLDADWTNENGKVIVEPLKTETGHTKDI